MKRQNITPTFEPDDNALRATAYQLWLDAGSPEGKDLEFWVKAERQLKPLSQPENVEAIPSRQPIQQVY